MAALAVSAALVVLGVAQFSDGAALIAAGVLLAAWSLLALAD